MRKIVSILICLILLQCCGDAQSVNDRGLVLQTKTVKEDTGKTYALIVGISKYKDPKIPQLQYADADAAFFYNFLTTAYKGQIDSSNIHLLLNDTANNSNMWEELSDIMAEAKSGDCIYFYFSGHGDAANSEDYYLITHETHHVSDASLLTPFTAFNVGTFKTKIKELTDKGVKFYMILDACRTNQDISTTGGESYRDVLGDKSKAIQMLSCQASQQAKEANLWGGGRGLFSYYLTQGLMGKADLNKDGKITLFELKRYVEDSVSQKTVSLYSGASAQIPDMTGPNLNEVIIKTSLQLTEQLLAVNDMMAATTIKERGLMDNVADTFLFNRYKTALDRGRLIEPANDNAQFWLDKLLEKTKDGVKKEQLINSLLAALLERGQGPINYYSRGLEDSLNYDYFYNASKYFKAALKYLDKNPVLYKDANAARLFLQARAMKESSHSADWKTGLLYADSALMLKQWAYIYHTKALLNQRLGKSDSIISLEKTAISLAPKWIHPYTGIANAFYNLHQADSGVWYIHKFIELNPDDEKPYLFLARFFYYTTKQKDSSFWCLRKAVEIAPRNSDIYISFGALYNELNKKDSAIWYYHKAIQINPRDENAYKGIGSTYRELRQTDSSLCYFHKVLEMYPKHWYLYSQLGDCFNHLHYNDSTIYYYHKAIEIDSIEQDPYFTLADFYKDNDENDSAIWYFKKAIEIDTGNPSSIVFRGSIKQILKQNDSAIYFYHKLIAIFNNAAGVYRRIGLAYQDLHQTDSALWYYSKAIDLLPDYEEAYIAIGNLYCDLHQIDSAIWYYNKTIGINPRNADAIRGLAYTFKVVGQTDSAAYYYKLNISLDSTYAKLYDNYGEFLKDIDKTTDAINNYKKAIALDPKYESSYKALVELYHKTGDEANAKKMQDTLDAIQKKK